jgi:hypothetical protein
VQFTRNSRWPFGLLLILFAAGVFRWFWHEQRQGSVAAAERVLRRRIETASKNGDWSGAERALASLANPTPADVLNRATMLTILNRPAESADQWSRLAGFSFPAEAELIRFLDLLASQKRTDQAIDLLRVLADRTDVSFPTAEMLLAHRLLDMGFPVEAARRLERPLQTRRELNTASRLQCARIFLSTGDPERAAEILNGEVSGSEDERAEWLWLLSRVALQRRDAVQAAAALERLRSFSPSLAASSLARKSEPAPFVGSESCAKCHQDKHRIQSRSSHAATLTPASRKSLEALPPLVGVADKLDPTLRYTFSSQENKVVVTVEREGKVHSAGTVTWQIGSGAHGVSFLVEASGEECEFALSNYPAHGWDTTTGHREGRDRANPLGRRLPRTEGDRCLACHATNVEQLLSVRPRNASASAELPKAVAGDLGVRCESCHGPGLHHVRAVELGFKQDWAIRQPAKLPAAASVELCAKCHQPSPTLAPTLAGNLRFQSATLRGSKCYEMSGKLSCVTCHDAHAAKPKPLSEHGKRCLECHARASLPCPPFTTSELKSKSIGHDSAEAASCITCHMPRVDDVMMHTSFTDHRIRVHGERSTTSKPNAEKVTKPATR